MNQGRVARNERGRKYDELRNRDTQIDSVDMRAVREEDLAIFEAAAREADAVFPIGWIFVYNGRVPFPMNDTPTD